MASSANNRPAPGTATAQQGAALEPPPAPNAYNTDSWAHVADYRTGEEPLEREEEDEFPTLRDDDFPSIKEQFPRL
jgi:hypothetical protein